MDTLILSGQLLVITCQESDMLENTSKMSVREFASKLWAIIRPAKKHGLWLGLVSAITLAGWSVHPIFTKYIVDGIFNGQKFHILILWLCAMVAVRLVASTTAMFTWTSGLKLSSIVQKLIEDYVMRKVLGFSVGQYTNENTGIKTTAINRGMEALNQLLNLVFFDFGHSLLSIIFYLVLLFTVGWVYGMCAIVLMLQIILFAWGVIHWAVPRTRKIEYKHRRFGKYQWELFHNVDLVKQNAAEARERGIVVRKLVDIWKMICSTWNKVALMSFFRSNGLTVVFAAVVFVGLLMIGKGMSTAGSLVAALMWIESLNGEMKQMASTLRNVISAYEPVRNLLEIMEVPPAITSPKNPLEFDLCGDIEFRNVHFRYEKGKSALSNASFHIKAGETVAFVGESGSGKTTVIRLLQRFYDPDRGQIFIDGHNLKDIDLKNYLRKIGAVSQEVKLFDTTLRQNIVYGLSSRQDVTNKQLEAVAKLARIDKFYSRLDKKFETLIGENGVKLSGGEKQRVSIARAMIKNPKILIFDEATSSLDVESESEIHKAIMAASKGRTTILIAHRLSTVIGADRIFVMKKGKIVGEGNHGSLMKSNSYYARLMKIQVLDLIKHNFPNLNQARLNKVLQDLGVE
ncbi:MAG: ABC transporter ATP-binding protein [Patescibacteria group bacterium]|nr:ABC transporter ATP-binding protein [Patescibacteria group bacterium]